MKNSKGETLKQPYLALAEMRGAQYDGTLDFLLSAFDWQSTPEGSNWWVRISNGEYPDIPAASLAELEGWRKAKDNSAEPPETNELKAKYEELNFAYQHLLIRHEELANEYEDYLERNKPQPTPDRNWIAECAMAAMQGLLAYYSGGSATRPKDDMLSEKSWTLAEAWAAEGVKRGHLPKTDNA